MRRPHYHFTPPTGWLNDPNGLVVHKSTYHLFYQHHPDAITWGPMHWGHAVSDDLHRWQHLDVALAPDPLGTIFSGSAIVDRQGVAGFGRGALVAVFTHHGHDREAQSLAYSTDGGGTWTKFKGNPVLEPPAGVTTFRDPRILSYSSGTAEDHFVMALAVDDEIWFYGSLDLRNWDQTGIFEAGDQTGRRETPDLIEAPVHGRDEKRWLLTFGAGIDSAEGTRTEYVTGRFDGRTFMADDPSAPPRIVDHGPDFYAAQSWSDDDCEVPVWIGWMNNWAYAESTPASSWRGSLSIPRRISLHAHDDRLRMRQEPVLGGNWSPGRRCTLSPDGEDAWKTKVPPAFEATLRVDVEHSMGHQLHVSLQDVDGELARLTYDLSQSELALERSLFDRESDSVDDAQKRWQATLVEQQELDLRLLVDVGSVEVLAAGGTTSITALVPPATSELGLVVGTTGGPVDLSIRLRSYTG